uniref:Major facilitator superfamily (MFS) profile domain-containing protein n=1 Tax=Timema bartmani TaxID=61472 RepID=A0A7R9HZB8_9NEOP|nr:unnamed protein product [Timema bartmani]
MYKTNFGDDVTSRCIFPQDGEFTWSEETQGFILSGYFYGYAAGQLPGGILAERYGGKLVFGLGTFISALLTVVSPFAVWVSDELFFALRLLEGLAGVTIVLNHKAFGGIGRVPLEHDYRLFQSVTFPAIQYMISNWAPPDERSKFSMVFSVYTYDNYSNGVGMRKEHQPRGGYC